MVRDAMEETLGCKPSVNLSLPEAVEAPTI